MYVDCFDKYVFYFAFDQPLFLSWKERSTVSQVKKVFSVLQMQISLKINWLVSVDLRE